MEEQDNSTRIARATLKKEFGTNTIENENDYEIEETGGSGEMRSRLLKTETPLQEFTTDLDHKINFDSATEANKDVVIETSGTDDSKKEAVIIDDGKYLPTILPDSGKRREFKTGSVRDSRAGKGRFDLMSPIALLRYAKHMEAGAIKYGDRNWEKGQPLMSYIDSAERHMNTWKLNRLTGRKDEEDHLAAIIWNIGAFMHTKEMIACGHLPAELDDVPGPLICGS